ncbi:RHS repeat-associated core domain-containing protein [Streptomyces sp. SL13]|uniref:RHS repeat-associated core domain-containing protein n=1 Tax=Streptantibioticus silvisoli TaxID=2705255 RepID=A0AA90H0Z5_9ACTN|nr:DUF6531 domain-containing protein [Streptantibioticus silvisoli]MDI5970086.1 RHS repeat-associated core domain-containing protein [Streptantibioticus silvisoli]
MDAGQPPPTPAAAEATGSDDAHRAQNAETRRIEPGGPEHPPTAEGQPTDGDTTDISGHDGSPPEGPSSDHDSPGTPEADSTPAGVDRTEAAGAFGILSGEGAEVFAAAEADTVLVEDGTPEAPIPTRAPADAEQPSPDKDADGIDAALPPALAPEAEAEEPDVRLRGGDAQEPLTGIESPVQESVENHERVGASDPVDVVTGEMFLSHVDAALPGILPLVLKRSHASHYLKGLWFGRSWSSTLDQRVDVDAGGVHYASPDGAVLHYPRPTHPGESVLPTEGARHPLTEDDDGIRIHDPFTGVTRHFATASAVPTPRGSTRRITAVTDRNNHRIEFRYHPDGRPKEVRHSGGYRIAVDTGTTSAGPRVTALRLLDGTGVGTRLVALAYDGRGRLTSVTNSSGKPLTFTYDDRDRITGWTDRNGVRYHYTFDAAGRVIRTGGPDGLMAARFHYDLPARTTTVTDSLGHDTVHHWNDTGQVVAITDTLGASVRIEQDRYRRLLSWTDKLGRTTRLIRDARGDVVRLDRPDGASHTLTYNDLHQPTSVTQPDGTTRHHTYDDRGNPVSSTDPAGATTTWAHDSQGRLLRTTDALGHRHHCTTGAAGLPLTITDALGHTTRIERDAFGRPTAITDPVGATTRAGWTTEGLPAWRVHPGGAREEWTYDAENNLLRHRGPLGEDTTFAYGPFDLLTARTAPDGARYTFAYDTELRLTRVTNPHDHTWTYTYDPAGRLTGEQDFDGRVLTYRTDAAGHLTERVNGAGQAVRLHRDPMGRTIARTDDEGATTTLEHDSAGRLVRATSPDSTVQFTYDACGRVLTEDVDGRILTNAYDLLGRRTHRTTSTGVRSVWTYDANGRPRTLSTADETLTFTHDPAGRETTRTLGTQTTLTQTWDIDHRLTAQTVQAHPTDGATAEILQQRTYTYRADGIPTHITDLLTGPRHYDLDPAGRVTAVRSDTWTETYAYDLLGNLTHTTAPPADPTTIGARTHTATRVRRAGRTTYDHDAQGRRTRTVRRTLSGRRDVTTYAWDPDDRLTAVTTPDGTRWRYTYDPLGRRTGKHRLGSNSKAGHRTAFTWDGTRLAEEIQHPEDANSIAISWDWQPGTHRAVTQTHRRPLSDDPKHTIYAIITDHLGTPRELVTTDGRVAWHENATLWGIHEATPDSGVHCPLRFPGQYHDSETGLNHNYHRYYDPEIAHYTTPDPLGLAAAPNANAYVGNPFAQTDPLGLSPTDQNASSPAEADLHTCYVLAGATPTLVHDSTPCTPVIGPQRPKGVGDDWVARTADNGKGTVWQKPGSTGNAEMLRVMNPTGRYPDGYVRFTNEHGQPIGLDGKPGSKADTHIPMNPDGIYPLPMGW